MFAYTPYSKVAGIPSTRAISSVSTVVSTALAMLAFAANSVLCRLALGPDAIDAVSFTLARFASGALTLVLIGMIQGRIGANLLRPHALSALVLMVYAIPFSLAYRDLTAGTGALLLFGSVQVTMIGTGVLRGERPGPAEWFGLLIALAGLGWLVSPGVSSPPLRGAALMIVAGVAWGVYSLRGRGGGDPLASTAGNFLWSLPIALLVRVAGLQPAHLSRAGLMWAILSGAIGSGVGYVIWYTALRRLTATRAATVQLTVPVIAAIAGVLFMSERVSLRLVLASVLVLGGVALAVMGKRVPRRRETAAAVGR